MPLMKSIFHIKLSLIQIECQDGFFGYHCRKCHCDDKDDVCNKTTGKCQFGCPEGWQEVNCTGMKTVYIHVHPVMER